VAAVAEFALADGSVIGRSIGRCLVSGSIDACRQLWLLTVARVQEHPEPGLRSEPATGAGCLFWICVPMKLPMNSPLLDVASDAGVAAVAGISARTGWRRRDVTVPRGSTAG
jgi:hypothetical protein